MIGIVIRSIVIVLALVGVSVIAGILLYAMDYIFGHHDRSEG